MRQNHYDLHNCLATSSPEGRCRESEAEGWEWQEGCLTTPILKTKDLKSLVVLNRLLHDRGHTGAIRESHCQYVIWIEVFG